MGLRQNVGVSVKRDSLGVGISVGAAGVAFGSVAVAGHFSVAQACVLSLLLFSGASQFALVGVMSSGGSPLAAILTGTFLGSRNGLYGTRMASILKNRGWRRVAAAQITIDESTGMAIAQEEIDQQHTAFWYTGIAVFFFWNICTFLGAVGAKAIGDTAAWGLDVVSPVVFIAVLWPRLTTRNLKLAALAAFTWALCITEVVPSGVPILTTVAIAVVVGWK
jgi:predicted branched-subunit amino acid permease